MTMPSGAASSRPRKSLVWRYLSLASRMPIVTTGPRSVSVGDRVRSTVLELPLECRSLASRTVISTWLSITAVTATFWNACIASRPKSSTVWPTIASAGMPTTSLAALFASRTTPCASLSTSASSDLSTVSVSAP